MTQAETAVPFIPLPPRYQLLTTLKDGRDSSVYRVFDVADRREEAIKILNRQVSDEQESLRFRAEFSTLASLEHPNIVRVFDFGVLPQHLPFFTMEFFPGRRISDYFDGKDWPALYRVILQIASALHLVHSRGVVHLDLKPSNILVSDDGVAKLMDFGLSLQSRQMFDRQIRGTLQYMAPEILRQDRVDGRADLYALGMTLYETVTGALPGYGRPAIEVIRLHLDEDVRPPSAINPNVPAALEAVILKLLEKDQRDRFPSAALLMEEIAAISGEKVNRSDLLAAHGGLLAAPLIGRDAEVSVLTHIVEEAKSGSGSGVIVAGAEGVGKSRIVRDVTLRAQLDGAALFCGRCPANRKTVFAPFIDIFQQMVAALNPEADVAAEMRRLLGAPRRGGDLALSEGRGKYRLFNNISQSLQDMHGFLTVGSHSAGAPLLLLIEDLQWADPSTIELFTFLAAEARSRRLVVFGLLNVDSTSEAPAGSSLPAAASWEQKARETSVPVVRVPALSENLVREHLLSLLGDDEVADSLSRWVLWESAGSPSRIRRILEYLIERDVLEWNGGRWSVRLDDLHRLRLPGGFSSILFEKIEALTREQRLVIEAISIFAAPIDFDTLDSVCDMDSATCFTILQSLVEAGLVEETGDGRRIGVRQVNIREAIYNSMPEARRAELHLRAAEALEPCAARGAVQCVGQAAYHFTRANDLERAARFSIEAGDLASRALAHEEAAEFYRAALELIDLGAGDESAKTHVREKLADSHYRRDDYRAAANGYAFLLRSLQSRGADSQPAADLARVSKKMGKVLARRGEYELALGYFQTALENYSALNDSVSMAEVLSRSAWLQRLRGDLEAALEASDRARTLLAHDRTAPIHGYVTNVTGLIEAARGNWDAARSLFTEAAAMGEAHDSSHLFRAASTNLGNVLWRNGEWEAAMQHFRRSIDQAAAEGDLWDLVSACNHAGVVEYGRGDFHAAAALFTRSVAIDEKIGATDHEASSRENLGSALEMLGRWDEAYEQYERCLAIDGFDESRSSRVSVYVPFARLMRKRGEIARAVELAQKAIASAERLRDEDLLAEALGALAAIEEERGNTAEARKQIERALQLFASSESRYGLARAHNLAASFALTAGEHETALRHAEAAGENARLVGDRFSIARNEWVRGKIAGALGRRDEAAEHFEEARAAFEELDTPYELARLLFDQGLLHEESDEATRTIQSAIRIFERLNAPHDLERARGALFRIRPSGRSGDQAVVGLYEIVKIINSTLDLNEVLNRVLDVCIRRLRAERGMIILLDPITGALRTRIVRNIREGSESEASRSPQSIVREVIQAGRTIISADARTDERFVASESVIAENILSILCTPLIIRERIAGAIYVDHRQTRHLFGQRDVSFLEAFADQAAIAIENARLYEELEEARTRLSLENETLRREVLVEKHLDSIIGQSEVVNRIQFAVRKASAGHSTVLLRGESGTGKGLVARIIHNIGPRRNGPFIKFNCAALPETLAESELFGHEKGAFTGADRRKLGRFELAHGGTIFLDEIGKLSLAMQSKLLRVVEEKEFERVGGTQTIKSDVKIIAATNLEIEKAIDDGSFREDLFYRLNIIPIVLPPLRERKDDIPILTEHFIRKICKDLGTDTKRLEPGVLDLFMRYDWPGNVRELEATIHRAIVMSNGDVMTRSEFYQLEGVARAEAPRMAADPSLPQPLVETLTGRREIDGDVYEEAMNAVDRQLILRALATSGGRIREASRRLGLARNTLKAKIVKYGIAPGTLIDR